MTGDWSGDYAWRELGLRWPLVPRGRWSRWRSSGTCAMACLTSC